MIYLLNSGYNKEYAINVLNTLHLPRGIENTFRYSSTPETSYIEESLKSTKVSDQEVLIMFIDRNDVNGYKYYPLRKGKLVNIERNETKYHFSVQLEEHYTVNDIDHLILFFNRNSLIKSQNKHSMKTELKIVMAFMFLREKILLPPFQMLRIRGLQLYISSVNCLYSKTRLHYSQK